MNEHKIMDSYESIRTLTSEMLGAARAAEWERFTALEGECRAQVDRLIAAEPQIPLDPPLLRRKIEIIHQVLADDAEIRRLTEPRLVQLEQYLGAAREQRRLARAYGAGAE